MDAFSQKFLGNVVLAGDANSAKGQTLEHQKRRPYDGSELRLRTDAFGGVYSLAESEKNSKNSDSQSNQSSVTELLQIVQTGDRAAEELLWERILDELRALGKALLVSESNRNSMSADSLAQEAYLRLTANDALISVSNRRHLMRLVGRAMRQVLVDRARRRQVRGRRVRLDAVIDSLADAKIEPIRLRDALAEFEEEHPRAAEVVNLRFFFQETIAATAKLLDVSASTVESDWRFAQAWLFRQMKTNL